MDAFVSRKRRRASPDGTRNTPLFAPPESEVEEDSTDIKLAILSSLQADRPQDDLLEVLLACEGSVEKAIEVLSLSPSYSPSPQKRKASMLGVQSSLPYALPNGTKASNPVQKGRTLHLYSPEDIAAHTPCSIIHNFLPTQLANDLLAEILPEVTTYTSATFKLFDNVVQSPHTACFYVTDRDALDRQKQDYLYNGSNLSDIRELLPTMRLVSSTHIRPAVNAEIASRIQSHYPSARKLRYQSPREWQPNAAFVNCYDGASQSVGYHSDQLSYLGPRCVIGSLSLGVEREFRVRRIVPPDSPPSTPNITTTTKHTFTRTAADSQGQISIHLPHNSLLIMHAEMQEEWKHAITPALTITPHPIAGNKRINITYRWYREEFHPKFTPRCRCGVPTVLKCVMKRRETRGRYMWMCQVGGRVGKTTEERAGKTTEGSPGKATGRRDEETEVKATKGNSGGCGFFEWAEFTDDGEPIWKHRANDHLKKAFVDDDDAAFGSKNDKGAVGGRV